MYYIRTHVHSMPFSVRSTLLFCSAALYNRIGKWQTVWPAVEAENWGNEIRFCFFQRYFVTPFFHYISRRLFSFISYSFLLLFFFFLVYWNEVDLSSFFPISLLQFPIPGNYTFIPKKKKKKNWKCLSIFFYSRIALDDTTGNRIETEKRPFFFCFMGIESCQYSLLPIAAINETRSSVKIDSELMEGGGITSTKTFVSAFDPHWKTKTKCLWTSAIFNCDSLSCPLLTSRERDSRFDKDISFFLKILPSSPSAQNI